MDFWFREDDMFSLLLTRVMHVTPPKWLARTGRHKTQRYPMGYGCSILKAADASDVQTRLYLLEGQARDIASW